MENSWRLDRIPGSAFPFPRSRNLRVQICLTSAHCIGEWIPLRDKLYIPLKVYIHDRIKSSLRVCFSFLQFLVGVGGKCSDKSSLRKERLVLVHSLRVQSTIVKESPEEKEEPGSNSS